MQKKLNTYLPPGAWAVCIERDSTSCSASYIYGQIYPAIGWSCMMISFDKMKQLETELPEDSEK